MRRTILTATLSIVMGAWLMVLLGVAPVSAERRAVTVKVDDKSPVDYVASKMGKAWAVVIGIDEYEKAPRLKYAVADAKALAVELERQGFQVTTLYNAQATQQAVLNELGDKLIERVGEGDRAVIFFAGHGETRKVKGGKEMGYLLPVNGEQESLAGTSLSMGLIRELADALPSKQVLFLVDVCYGGVAGQQFRSLPPMTEVYLKTITRERGRQLITAGGPEQQAMEGPEWGHSVFTHYLLEGLGKGLADLNDDGIIPASELYTYLESRVFAAAQLKGHIQRPELWALAAEKGEFVFISPTTGSRELTVKPARPLSPELAKAEKELKVLREQEEQVEEEKRLAAAQQEIESKKKQLQERSKPAEPTRSVVINGTTLSSSEIQNLERTYGVPIQPGRYWYDRLSGLWGMEGGPTVGQILPNLNLGGALRADASNGNTGVFINGREIHVIEVANLQKLGPVLPGRYWMNAQGIGGMEGGPPVFNLGAAITAQQKKGGGMGDGYNRTTPGGHLGSDGNCSYYFDPKSGSSVMSGNCE